VSCMAHKSIRRSAGKLCWNIGAGIPAFDAKSVCGLKKGCASP